jgi:glycosyltransferase involved in cell wall biosynthesis
VLVSIIINNYNYGRFLAATISSALNQTYGSTEVIVVDDGSTDESRDVITSFGDRVHAILKPNGGQASAFNVGYEASRGEIIVFLDSDDLLNKDAIQQIVLNWSSTFSKLQFPLQGIDETGNSVGIVVPKARLSEGDVLPELLRTGSYSTAPTSGNAFRREFLAQVMPIPERNWISHADCYIIHLAPFFGLIGRLDLVLGKYRFHTNSLSLSSFLTGGKISTDKVRQQITRFDKQTEFLQDMATIKGVSMSAETIMNSYLYYKFKLALFKLDRSNYPFVGDTLASLVGIAVRKVWRAKSVGLVTKCTFTAWAFLVALAPMSMAERLIIQGISPKHRAHWLRPLVVGGRKDEATRPLVNNATFGSLRP